MNGLVEHSSPSCPYSASSKATAEYQKLSGCATSIPVEEDAGTGLDCSHWDETCFQNEIMTGFTGNNLLLSRMTIASLEDMGYVVNYDAADDYGVQHMDPSCVCLNDESSSVSNGVEAAMLKKKKKKKKPEKKKSSPKQSTVHKLGKGGPKSQLAQLSLSGLLEAELYGKALLKEAKLRKQFIIEREGYVYLGDQVVSVLYMEDGQIYGVQVMGD